MSLIINAKGNQFASINNAQDKREGTVSFSELEDGFKFCLAPRPVQEKERTTLFIAGESGAGRSHFKRYKAMFPKNQIYLISYLDEDETLDAYKEIIRINAFQTEFLDECLDLDIKVEFGNSLVIFDDIDSIVNKKTKEKIYGLLNKMLRTGRHFGTSVAYVGHELYASPELKSILNESMTITFFPRFLSYKKLKYLLERTNGEDKSNSGSICHLHQRQ